MKQAYYILVNALLIFVFPSCEDNMTEEFEEINGDVEARLLSSVLITNLSTQELGSSVLFSYSSDNRLISITNNNEITFFIYDVDGTLEEVRTQSEGSVFRDEILQGPLSITNFVGTDSPVEIQTDNNGNPTRLTYLESSYDNATQQIVYEEVYYEITYDNKPNPYFFVVQSAGMSELLNTVNLNLGIGDQNPDLVLARTLFPNNNPSSIRHWREDGTEVFRVTAVYDYDGDFPVSALVYTETANPWDDETPVSATFIYKN